jgi:hypothetical protein
MNSCVQNGVVLHLIRPSLDRDSSRIKVPHASFVSLRLLIILLNLDKDIGH